MQIMLIVIRLFIIIPRTRLTLSSFDRRDEGTYYCVSKNEMGITRGNIQVFSEFNSNDEKDDNSWTIWETPLQDMQQFVCPILSEISKKLLL